MSCASVVCVWFYLILFNYSYVASYSYVRQTKWAVCVISVWAHYEIVIERSIDRSLNASPTFSWSSLRRVVGPIPATVLRLLIKQDNAPVKAQSYSHILSTSKHS